jgi:hypothetical protein
VQPLAAFALYNALCAQNKAVFFIGKSSKNAFQLLLAKLLSGFCAKANKYFIGVMMMVVMSMFMIVMMAIAMRIVALVIMMVMFMFVVMMAFTFGVITLVLVMMVVMVLMLMMFLILIVVVMVVTFTLFIVTFTVVMVMMLVLVVFLFIVMVMMVAMALGIITFVLVVVMVNVSRKACEFLFNGVTALHSRQKLCTVKSLPRSGYNGCCRVLFAQECYGFGNLFFICALRMRKNDATRVLDLVIEKLTKVLHIHFALHSVNNGCKAVKRSSVSNCTLGSLYNVGKLTNARRLDENSIGLVLVNNLLECL